MPYPNALLQATPRNALLGNVADFIAQSYSPERTQQAQGVANYLMLPQISRTLDRLSYGEPLTTGAGGIGGTTRFNNDALDAAMAIAPTIGPAAKLASKGAMATGRFVAPKAGQLAEQYMVKQGMISPLDVYHGTPHTLPPTARNPLGEFDASKIGSGEGAQAYGHGIYVAENPAVAKDYQVKLSSTGSAKNLVNQFGDVDKGLAEAQRRVQHYQELIANGGGGAMDRAQSFLRISEKNLQDLSRMKAGLPENTGSLYKIDLPDQQIAKMLDYDKHLSEQSPEVQKILMPYQKEIGSSFGTGEQTLKAIAFERRMKGLDDSPAAVAQQLKEMGIPGVRYLDEKSRGNFMIQNTYKGKPYGEPVSFMTEQQAKDYAAQQVEKGFGVQEIPGTRNFVVFPGEEKNMTILERNGQRFNNSALTGGKFVAPQDEALRLAQQRASLPPAQGGLGLSAGNTPEQRAATMGFDVNLYHGTTDPTIKRFDPSLAGKKSSNAFDDNVFATTSPQNAGGYALNWQSYKKDVETSPAFKALSNQENSIARQFADLPAGPSAEKKALTNQLETVRVNKINIFNDFMEGKHVSEDATIYPLVAKSQDFLPYDAAGKNWIRANRPAIDAAKEAGYAGTAIKNVKDNAGRWTDLVADSYATTNPDLFRSRFAAFDPFRKTAAIAAAAGLAAPDLLAGQSQPQTRKFDNSALK